MLFHETEQTDGKLGDLYGIELLPCTVDFLLSDYHLSSECALSMLKFDEVGHVEAACHKFFLQQAGLGIVIQLRNMEKGSFEIHSLICWVGKIAFIIEV